MSKNDLFRVFRLVHGWLSAFAFVALAFFAFTGLLLNHPEWLSQGAQDVSTQRFALTSEEVSALRGASHPSEVLAKMVARRVDLIGELKDERGEQVGEELFVRLQGVRGTTFLRADLGSSSVEVTLEPTSTF